MNPVPNSATMPTIAYDIILSLCHYSLTRIPNIPPQSCLVQNALRREEITLLSHSNSAIGLKPLVADDPS